MKIAFIGTHGIGKTTLAYELCNELKKQHLDVGFIDEIARRGLLLTALALSGRHVEHAA